MFDTHITIYNFTMYYKQMKNTHIMPIWRDTSLKIKCIFYNQKLKECSKIQIKIHKPNSFHNKEEK
jgi:hypothetical protein